MMTLVIAVAVVTVIILRILIGLFCMIYFNVSHPDILI